MDDSKNTSTTLEASKAEEMKAKYGRVYRTGIMIPVDDDSSQEFSYYFKRPTIPSYDRYVQSGSKVGITKASRAFLLDNVVDEDRDRLLEDLEEYPAVAISVSNKLLEILGLAQDVNLKKL